MTWKIVELAEASVIYIYIDELESLHTWELTYRFKAFARLTRLRPFC